MVIRIKNNSALLDFWQIGSFAGQNRAVGFVTVEPGWLLKEVNASDAFPVGGSSDPKGPYRYYMSTDGALSETIEIPNVKTIEIDRSLDTDAATCRISIYNQWHEVNNLPPELAGQLGRPGYFTATRGASPEGIARWNHEANDWADVIAPNALLRTYQGYGGYDVDGNKGQLDALLTSGNVVITGTWLVDRVTVDSQGMLNVECRDMAKLLIDQMLYVPLVPPNQYPAKFYRWKPTNFDPIWDPGGQLLGVNSPPIKLPYWWSSTDIIAAVGPGYPGDPVLGHFPAFAVDGFNDTYSLGTGFDTQGGGEVLDWWEFLTQPNQGPTMISKVYISPWEGPYTAYISIIADGVWQGTETIPYSIGGTDVGGGVPYVLRTGIPRETGAYYNLPGGPYNATLVRITLRDPQYMQTFDPLFGGPGGPYRSGLKEVEAAFSSISDLNNTIQSARALIRHSANGYRVIDQFGQQFSFGTAAPNLTESSTPGISTQIFSGIAHPTAEGFWTVETNGRVHAFGASTTHLLNGVGPQTDAVHVGANDFIDIATTASGNGYWLLRRSGGVYTFGDAGYLSGTYDGASTLGEIPSQTPITDTGICITGDPSSNGYWIVSGTGKVGYFGGATFYGELTPPLPPATAKAHSLVPTDDNDGYHIFLTNGQLFHYGAGAVNDVGGQPFPDPTLGGTAPAGPLWWRYINGADHEGAWGLRNDGQVWAFGTAENFGNPLEPGGTILTDGNFFDYADIIKELCLWAGFALPELFGGVPIPAGGQIHGRIETTGAWAEEPITEDIFDKRPVLDPITQIKEIVGYLFMITDEGGIRFDSPNWWAPGNFYEDGTPTPTILEIDESRQLFEYQATFTDENMRSEIMITNALPSEFNDSTITTRYIPPGQNVLHGMIRPAIWSNEVFSRIAEQQVMAELIALHIWFSQRQGQVTCYASPLIQLDDQVRIWERTTAESYIHYVRGITTSMDLDTGEYIANITTHWLGSEAEWVIRAPGGVLNPAQNDYFAISSPIVDFLGGSSSPAANSWATSDFTGG